MQHYLYKGVEYKSERELRKAIFEQERKAFSQVNTAEDWLKFGVILNQESEVEHSEPHEPDLAELKQMKIGSLEGAFNEYRHSNKTYLVSSLGFKVNTNVTAFDNVSGLVAQLKFKVEKGEENPKVGFMTFDDELVMLGLEEMKILQVEISENGSDVYSQKWELRQAIQNAENEKDLEAIDIHFVPTDFSIKD